MNDPSNTTISCIVSVLRENVDYLELIDATNPMHLRYEAQDWAKYGFAPEEVTEWIQAGYEGFADVARVLCNAGLSPRQAGCALVDNRELLNPGWAYDTEEEFVRRALAYRNCCLGRP